MSQYYICEYEENIFYDSIFWVVKAHVDILMENILLKVFRRIRCDKLVAKFSS